MKTILFTVIFIDNTRLEIYAESALKAMYLAIAIRIQLNQVYSVDSVSSMETKQFFVTNKSENFHILKELK